MVRTKSYIEHFGSRINMIMPRALDDQLLNIQRQVFSDEWLRQPDAEGHFPTNGDRFIAQEVMKRQDLAAYTRTGFLLQLFAAGWHHKSPQQLAQMADQIGRERIQIIHGTADNMINILHGELLVQDLGGSQSGLTFIRAEGRGHGLQMEWRRDLTRCIAAHVAKVEGSP